jgi:Na+-translocating ferredoxin:NAD+ oxidoreductase RnfD subunit
LLNSDLGKQIIGGVSQETHHPADKTASVISIAMPILMGAMKRNVNSQEGANG